MNRKSFVRIGVLLVLAANIAYAAGNDAFMGTWKLNEAKSKLAAGMPKNSTVGYVVKAKVLNDGPGFSGAAANSIPQSWTVTVVNRGGQPADVTTYVTCVQPN